MSHHHRSEPRPWALPMVALLAAGCGGGNSVTVVPSPAPPSPSPVAIPSPSPSAAPSPTPTPDAQARCQNLASGPVTRLAVAPRGQAANDEETAIMVRARPGFDEVWCVDKDKEHRLDFNLNQRNADGRECCWVGDPDWTVDDPLDMVTGRSGRDSYGFVYRVVIAPKGLLGSVRVSSRLDGVASHPWQSGSGYRQGPLEIVTMSAADIERTCLCIYRGNGIYEGARCPK